MSLLDKTWDFLLEKLWEELRENWKASKRRVVVGILFVLLVGGLVLWLLPFVPLLPYLELSSSSRGPLAAADRSRVVSTQKRVTARLINYGDSIRTSDPSDIWSYGDILVGLGYDSIWALSNSDHRHHIISQIRDAGACWTRQYGDACHMGATAWALLGLGQLGEVAPVETWKHLIDTQQTEGWWALYQGGEGKRENASTYATAIIAVAAKENLDLGLVPPDIREEVAAAVTRATSWLMVTRSDEGSAWVDYPYRSRREAMIAISGLVIFVLNRADEAAIDEINAHFCEKYAGIQASPSSFDVSLVQIPIAEGQEVVDHVRHLRIVWQGIGLAAAYKDCSSLDQAKIRRFFRRSLFSKSPNPEHELQGEWMVGEFGVLLRLLLSGSSKLLKSP